jgi:hypothetical protein
MTCSFIKSGHEQRFAGAFASKLSERLRVAYHPDVPRPPLKGPNMLEVIQPP